MDFKPPSQLEATDLLVFSDRVMRLDRKPTYLGEQYHLMGYDNQSLQPVVKDVDSKKPVAVDEPLLQIIPRAGSIEVELAGVRNYHPDTHWTYRYRVRDEQNQTLVDRADINDSRSKTMPDNKRGMATLISFLGAAAVAQDTLDRGGESDNAGLFDDAIREWAQRNSDELQMLHMELAPEEYQDLSAGLE